jgi:putative ABC transport system permease protein
MPPQLSLRSTGAQLWVPLRFTRQELNSPGARFLVTVGRLRRGVSAAQAQAELAAIARHSERVRPNSNAKVTARVRSLHEAVVSQVREAAFILLAAVSFVLLIACANVANLLLARATRRQAEMGVRAALGASRSRIARQLLAESAVIGLAGAATGLALAYAMAEMLKNVLPQDIPRLQQTRVDLVVLGFTLVVSLVASLLFGAAPALRASRVDLQQVLRDESYSSRSFRRRRWSSTLVVGEVALALVLLVAAGLLLRSFVRLQRVDTGFDAANLLTARMSLPEARYDQPQKIAAFYEELAANLGRQPGVAAAAVASTVPLTGSGISISMIIEGRPVPAHGEETPNVFLRFVSADYFRTLGVRIARGRGFSGADRANTAAVAIVNETAARRYWPDQDPLGQRFTLDDDRGGVVEIVGVAADVRHFSLAESPAREVFMPLSQTTPLNWQWLQRSMIALARITGEPESAAGAIRQVVRALDDQLPVSDVRSMDQIRFESLGDERAGVALVGTFASVALVLASIGVYGVMAVMVAGRSREIGIRLALGARPRDVRRMILRDGAALTAIGVVIGMIAAFALTRTIEAMLFETPATDALTLIVVSAVIAVAATVACWVPARRSTRVDPVVALRAG